MAILRKLLAAALLISWVATASATATSPSLIQYCGKNSTAEFQIKAMRWDCSEIQADTLSDLEEQVKTTHSVPEVLKGTDHHVYEADNPHYSAWVFGGQTAIRYRALFDEGRWVGIGVTTYCAASKDVCTRMETFAAGKIPPPLLFKLGPPSPEF